MGKTQEQKQTVEGKLFNPCKKCKGIGEVIVQNDERECPDCEGRGFIVTPLGNELIDFMMKLGLIKK